MQADLVRGGITPACWVVNQSLLAYTPVAPVLRARADEEARHHLDEVTTTLARSTIVLPRTSEAPVVCRLHELVGDHQRVADQLIARTSSGERTLCEQASPSPYR